MNKKPNLERDTLLSVRTTADVKAGLKELAGLMSEELGMKMTQVQTLEKLINDALRARRGNPDV